METLYRHTQIGRALIAGLCAVAAVTLVLAMITPMQRGSMLAAVGVVLLCALLFPSLTTVLHADHLHCYFGFGVIGRRIPFAEISGVEVVRNSPFYGWGLRLTPHGWLWNVAGLDAVELRLRGGSKFRIGSDEAPQLAAALQQQLKAAGLIGSRRRA